MDEFDLFEQDLRRQRRLGITDGVICTAIAALITVLALICAGVL